MNSKVSEPTDSDAFFGLSQPRSEQTSLTSTRCVYNQRSGLVITTQSVFEASLNSLIATWFLARKRHVSVRIYTQQTAGWLLFAHTSHAFYKAVEYACAEMTANSFRKRCDFKNFTEKPMTVCD